MSKPGDALQKALNALNEAIIKLASNTNTESLKNQVKEAWQTVAIITHELDTINEIIAVANAEISYLNKDKENTTKLEKYYRFRQSVAKNRTEEQERKLAEAQSKEKNETTMKKSDVWIFSWSSSKKEKIDTSWTQENVKKRIQESNSIVEEFSQKISDLHKNRAHIEERAKNDSKKWEDHKKVVIQKLKEATSLAQSLQSTLDEQLLQAAGVSRENALKINTIFKITIPMSRYMSNSLGEVTAMFTGIKNMAIASGKLSMRSTLAIGNNLCKLALLGEYLSSGSFYLANDPYFQVYQETAKHTLGRIANTLITKNISDPKVIDDVRALASHKDDEIDPNYI
jgi:hypothetical protein